MDLNRLSPYVRVALDHYLAPGWVIRERTLFDYELLYVKEGRLRVTTESGEYDGVPGDLFLFKPGQRHAIEVTSRVPVRQPHVHFDLLYMPDSPDVKVSFKPIEDMSPAEIAMIREDVVSAPPFELPTLLRLRSPAVFENMLLDLIRDFRLGLPYAQTAAKGAFLRLWVHLLREHTWQIHPQLHSNWERLTKVKQYIDHNPEQNVSLAALAEMAGLSPYYFLRAFSQAYGLSPMKYCQTVRIGKAREWIQFTSLPLTEIAERVGFASIHAFSRTFKRIDGVAPSFYRGGKAKNAP
ncbi:AraC family transcriptional regulator [Paenibacillus ginsengarvi]|uniref:AraC family transcriptional regulator n=2 Tax=Paenibacillus ginsengarvi TaxID=400777 RepID=A0A3B0BVT3_9BACL|nr:AraC family transcriptional regulator [Paenibacillus ginsengarvi]